MEIQIIKTGLKEIEPLRLVFLHENNFQFVYNKCHMYGWADTYLFKFDNIEIGYGAVWGKDKREDRDAIFEFFIVKPYRQFNGIVFQRFCAASAASFIECQTNDALLSSMLYEHAQNINAEAILFKDHFQTGFVLPGAMLHKKTPEPGYRYDDIQYTLVQDEITVASGGLMLNYNMPYADLYYEVGEAHRRKGFGTLIIQELKKAAYLMGRAPAARCNIRNAISKAALLKAGFMVCGHIVTGEIKKV